MAGGCTWEDGGDFGADSESFGKPEMHGFADEAPKSGARLEDGDQTTRRNWQSRGQNRQQHRRYTKRTEVHQQIRVSVDPVTHNRFLFHLQMQQTFHSVEHLSGRLTLALALARVYRQEGTPLTHRQIVF